MKDNNLTWDGWPKNDLPSRRLRVYNRDGWKCLCCGSTDNLTLDHVIPKSKGGYNSMSNLQTLCQPCNNKKADTRVDFRKNTKKMVGKFMEKTVYKGYTISTSDRKEWTLMRGFTPIIVRSLLDAKAIVDGTKTLQEV